MVPAGTPHRGGPTRRSLPRHHAAGHQGDEGGVEMKPILTIAKRELSGYFASPVAFVFIVIFLLLSGFFTFMVAGLFSRGQANLEAFFTWHPWRYLFLVPAVGMRMCGEERTLGTIELLLTMPG